MKIGTAYFFDSRSRQMAAMNASTARIQEQIATGKRILTPSDDPLASARLARLGATVADEAQFAGNIRLAQSLLGQSESALESIQINLQRAQELALRAGNDTLNADNRAAVGAELNAILDDLLALANAKDLRGEPLFGGSAGTEAYARAPDGTISFAGVGEAPPIPIGASVSVQATDSGPRLFEGIDVGGVATDMFKVVGDLAKALMPGGAPDPAALKQAIADGADGLKKAFDQVTTGRTSVGARAARLEIEAERLAQAAVDSEIERGSIEGVDIQTAVIDLQKTMLALQATQASFTQLSRLSLFDYIR
jgi:flagellar hook-associated protein 3 FlgL